MALVEIYDTDYGLGDTTGRLDSLSTRGQVGTGENVLIGGFAIGGRADGSFWWNGSADEVALYSKALTTEEISAHYANGTATSPAATYQNLVLAQAPIAYYRLNEGTYTAPASVPPAATTGTAGASIAAFR